MLHILLTSRRPWSDLLAIFSSMLTHVIWYASTSRMILIVSEFPINAGDNAIIGSRDGKLCWFDLDLATRPYRSLRYITLLNFIVQVIINWTFGERIVTKYFYKFHMNFYGSFVWVKKCRGTEGQPEIHAVLVKIQHMIYFVNNSCIDGFSVTVQNLSSVSYLLLTKAFGSSNSNITMEIGIG